jgi:hypothetical protein
MLRGRSRLAQAKKPYLAIPVKGWMVEGNPTPERIARVCFSECRSSFKQKATALQRGLPNAQIIASLLSRRSGPFGSNCLSHLWVQGGGIDMQSIARRRRTATRGWNLRLLVN